MGAEWGAQPDDDHSAWTLAATGGAGADFAMVCAASESSAPIQLAADLCRLKGRVVCGRRDRDGPRPPQLLREGARPADEHVLRPRPLRPPLRGTRPRLPDLVRPLDREPQPPGLHRTRRLRRDRPRAARRANDSVCRGRPGLRRTRRRRAKVIGGVVPLRPDGHVVAQHRTRHEYGALDAQRSGCRIPRRRQLRQGHLAAGGEPLQGRAQTLDRHRDRPLRPRHCGEVRLRELQHGSRGGLSGPGCPPRLRRDATRQPRTARGGRAARGQGGLAREAGGTHGGAAHLARDRGPGHRRLPHDRLQPALLAAYTRGA